MNGNSKLILEQQLMSSFFCFVLFGLSEVEKTQTTSMLSYRTGHLFHTNLRSEAELGKFESS